MSTIEKLTIQGIRSFGTKKGDVQAINFSSPVTLILGQNGCGKTTIIECLKYALTGEAPPGSNRGQNFIHDPKIYGYGESLGQVKLMAKNILHERVTVCRSMKMAHKRGKPSFETLDASIVYMATTGDTTGSVSKRCVDVDVTMCQFMGVSKAILNNVIFCHQEDSSWPLDEPKKLKEKFDAIFGISEYNKAIERIIKFRKDYLADLKLRESNLRYLRHLKQEMEDKEISIQKEREKCSCMKELCISCDEEIKLIDDRLLDIRKIEYEIGKHQALKVELETRQKNYLEQMASLNEKIREKFSGDIHELNREIQRFDQKMLNKKLECRDVEDKLSSLKNKEKRLQQVLIDLDKKHASYIQKIRKENEYRAERAEKVKTLCKNLQIDMNLDSIHNIADILDQIQNSLQEEQGKIATITLEYDQADHQRQVEIDGLRVDLTKVEEGIVALKTNKEEHEKEFSIIEQKIVEVEKSHGRLKKISADVERINKCFEEFRENLKQNDLKKSIANSKAKITNLQEHYRKLDERITFLNSISKTMAEISLREKELDKREKEVQRIRGKHSGNFKSIFEQPVVCNFRRNLQLIHEKLRRQIKESNENANALKLKKQSFEIKRKNIKDNILQAENEIEESQESIYEKCGSTPYDILLNKCKESVSKYQLEYSAMRSAEAMYKKYIQKIEECPRCPLCNKEISGSEAAVLTAELSDEICRLPTNTINAEKQLKAEQQRYEELLQMRPILDKLSHLRRVIPKRKNELKDIESQLADCENIYESMELELAELSAKLDLANLMLGDMSLLDEAIKDVARLTEEISGLKEKLPQESYLNTSFDDLRLAKTAISAELENERVCLEKQQLDYEDGIDALTKLREKLNRLKDEQVNLQGNIQSLSQLKERKIKISNLIWKKSSEIRDLQLKVHPLQQKLNVAINEKSRLRESNRKIVEDIKAKYDLHKKIDYDIQRLNKEVIEYNQLNLCAEIRSLEDSIARSTNEVTENSNLILKLSENLEAIKSECMSEEIMKRNLKDNREYMILKQRKSEIEKHVEELSETLRDLDFRNVSKEKGELIQKRDLATVQKGELLGQIGEINNQISKLSREISEPKYKYSVINYRRSLYEVNITREIIADLGQYRLTLERSLLQFHAGKMERINRLIREYWRHIYRGNDIDYIEIQTDEIKIDSSADRKRSYNYRVVQSKNNAEIEMRGRCSAGQRVLASLIIRIALAETFSSNCGVLALDEPTTNLDHVNILSLCEALNRIVDDRQSQSNFMLIVITHDENFISTLGKIKSYHRVFRNDDGKSIIRKVKKGFGRN